MIIDDLFRLFILIKKKIKNLCYIKYVTNN